MVKEAISITLDTEIIVEVKNEAERNNRSKSYIVNKKLKEGYGL